MAIRYWGNDKLANTTTANGQSSPVVAGLNNGGFVTAWVDDMGAGSSVVKFQRFDALGNKVGVETVLPVADGEGDQIKPSIAAMADGGFVIALQDMDPAISPTASDVRALRFDSSGLLINQAEFPSLFPASDPTVVANGTGYEVALSENFPADTDPVVLRVNSSNVQNPISVVPGGANHRFATVSASDGSNSYVHYVSGNLVIMNRIDALSGVYPASSHSVPLLTMDYSIVGLTAVRVSNSIFVAGTLVQYNSFGDISYYTDMFVHDSNGSFIARHVLPSAGSPVQFQALGDGTFVAVFDQPGGGGSDVFMQQFSATGTPIGAALPIAEGTVGEINPDVTRLADGRLVVTWTDTSGSDGSGAGVYQRIVDPREGFITGSNDTAAAETLVGNDSFNDHILGRAGNDTMFGLAGTDVLYGGDGLDVLNGGRGDDTLYGGADADSLNGEAGDDALFGEGGSDRMSGGLGADELDGGAGDDGVSFRGAKAGVSVNLLTGVGTAGEATGDTYINMESFFGSEFADTVIGGAVAGGFYGFGGDDNITGTAGIDRLIGGLGNDTLNGLGGIDRVYYDTSLVFVQVNLATNVNTGGEAQGDILSNIEEVSGSAFGDTIVCKSGTERLIGNGGNDRLEGATGADFLTGGAGSDTFVFALGHSGQTTTTVDIITDYTRGALGVGDVIDYSSALTVGGSAATFTPTEASINAATGVATFATGSGLTLADALADIATRMTTAGDAVGEFAFFQLGLTTQYMFISDGVEGVGANDVVVQFNNQFAISSINLDNGDLTIL
jgi:Ca2+-binding RTX toxin-like protein